MTKEEIKLTKTWKINDDRLVVADSIPQAIEIFKTKYPGIDVKKIELIPSCWDWDYTMMAQSAHIARPPIIGTAEHIQEALNIIDGKGD